MPVRVAFYKGRQTKLDRALSWWMSSPYSHCEIVLRTEPDGRGLCVSSSNRDGGVRIKAIDVRDGKWDVFWFNSPAEYAWHWARRHAGQKYDLIGLLGFDFRPVRGESQRWWCSEACAAMLQIPDPWRYDVATLASAVRYSSIDLHTGDTLADIDSASGRLTDL